ncbi:hypothetical protein [Rhodococcus sp. 1163]|nr:hypothetical protein [Rhodococcus sp. 1163]
MITNTMARPANPAVASQLPLATPLNNATKTSTAKAAMNTALEKPVH